MSDAKTKALEDARAEIVSLCGGQTPLSTDVILRQIDAALSEPAGDDVERVASQAEQNLRDNQQQLDIDGCMVGVSRQALDEVLQELADARAAISAMPGRDAVIEECAKLCDLIGIDWRNDDQFKKFYGAEYLAKQIRALKSSPPPSEEELEQRDRELLADNVVSGDAAELIRAGENDCVPIFSHEALAALKARR